MNATVSTDPQTSAANVDKASSGASPQGSSSAASQVPSQPSGEATGQGSPDADEAAKAAAKKKLSPQEVIEAIERETEETIRKAREDAVRRIALAQKTAIPLPQRKTNAFDFMEKAREYVRTTLVQPTLADADADAHIQTALDAWIASKRPAAE
jgi:hypothetical protein